MKEFIQSGSYFIVVDYLLYIVLIAVTAWTVYVLIHAPVKEQLAQARYRSQLKRSRMVKKEIPLSKRSSFYRHIYFLLQSLRVSKDSKTNTDALNVYGFISFCGLLGILTLILVVIKFNDAFVGLLIGAIVSLIPYAILLVRLRNTRNAVGNQLTEIVEILIHSYSSSGSDMYQGLKITSTNIVDKELRRIFIKLISDLQTARSEEEMRESIDLFIYTCGNSWAMRLGNIILKAYIHQETVLGALLQLQSQMINNEKMLEQEKADSFDSFNNSVLAIFLFPISLVGAKFVTRPQSWFVLQFQEKWAFMLFIVTVIMVIVGFLVGLLIRKPKNDI